MKIVLATGIYPPDIGGPATYCRQLAEQLTQLDHDIIVLTYGDRVDPSTGSGGKWKVESVSKLMPIVRWFLYAKKLRKLGIDADIVYTFSSVSCGIPLILSGLKKPKRILRLGGDFLWERYTDLGGQKSLRDFYVTGHWSLVTRFMGWILRRFDYIVFSTEFQQEIYEKQYKNLPKHSVIENALALDSAIPMEQHSMKKHFRLLFVGRFVGFKNLLTLIEAMTQIPDCVLTMVGEGLHDDRLRSQVEKLGLQTRVQFVAPLSGKEKYDVFASHDLLVLPSLTEISPNTALEARSSGLPVLLTQENGLSETLLEGIETADLSTPKQIVIAVRDVREHYTQIAETSAQKISGRLWSTVSSEHQELFSQLL